MKDRKRTPILERFSTAVSRWAGSTSAFAIAVGTVIVWLVTGPVFGYSDSWQLIINTGTTIVTFLMVFLIQRSQNKESLAVQLKLNELVAAMRGRATGSWTSRISTKDELEVLRNHYVRLANMAGSETPITRSHSIDEAAFRHEWKKRRRA